MYQSGLDHRSLFCGTIGTPGKLPTTTSRGTATSESKVSNVLFTGKKTKYLIQLMRMQDEQKSHAFLTEEKKGSLQDMANQRGVACRAQGWKIHLCAAQLRQLVSAGLRPAKIQHCSVVYLQLFNLKFRLTLNSL